MTKIKRNITTSQGFKSVLAELGLTVEASMTPKALLEQLQTLDENLTFKMTDDKLIVTVNSENGSGGTVIELPVPTEVFSQEDYAEFFEQLNSLEDLSELAALQKDMSNYDLGDLEETIMLSFIASPVSSLRIDTLGARVDEVSCSQLYTGTSEEEIDISRLNASKVNNLSQMFDYCENLTSVNLGALNFGENVSFEAMFRDCAQLTELDFSKWGDLDISKINRIDEAFSGCESLELLDIRCFVANSTSTSSSKIDGMFGGIPETCKIVVRDEAVIQYLQTALENDGDVDEGEIPFEQIKTVAEAIEAGWITA